MSGSLRLLVLAATLWLSSAMTAPVRHATRRSVTLTGLAGAVGGFVLGGEAPDVSASGVSFEEAAKNAEKYRVKGVVCTPTRPENCSAQYEKTLDPRRRLTQEQLAARDARNEQERAGLRSMMAPPR
mmetsp:Transcript_3017/g.9400  ORF Transcript_3017/g.9400 Transcript_3017/m.9400 type:complete len:127 (+) Transcript_3017:80-460(+)